MKNILIILVSFVFLLACVKDKSENTAVVWDRNKLLYYIQYAEDGVTELYRDQFDYNSLGLLIAQKTYVEGELTAKSYGYLYMDKARTFLTDMHQKNSSPMVTTVEEMFLDNSYSPDKLVSRTSTLNGELSCEEYVYDDEGFETGYNVSYANSLKTEYINYSYDNGVLTSVLNIYVDGEPMGKRKVKIKLFGKEYLRTKFVSRVQYQGETDAEHIREDYMYDAQGREIGYKSYYLGNLTSEQKDYVYDDRKKMLTFDLYDYSQHVSDRHDKKNKVKIVFY